MMLNKYFVSLFEKRYPPIIILGSIMIIFVVLQYGQLESQYLTPYDEGFIKPKLVKCELSEIIQYRAPIKLLLLCSSNEIFHNPRIIEFILVLFMFPLVYGITKEITKNSYTGLVSCAVLLFDRIFSLQSFTIYGSSEWVFFFFLAVYCMYKNQYLVGVFLLASFASKGLMLLFVPVMMLWLYKIEMLKRSKMIGIISISLAVIVTLLFTVIIGEQLVQKISITPDTEKLEQGLLGLLFVFRDDSNYLLLIFPISVVCLVLSRKNKIAMTILLFILLFYLSVLALPMLSGYSMFDYRMIPMVILSAIGIGMVAPNLIKHDAVKNRLIINKKQILLISAFVISMIVISPIILKQNDTVFMNDLGLPVSIKSTWSFNPAKNDAFMQKISDNCNAIIVYESSNHEFKGLVGCNPNANEIEIAKTQDAIRTIMNQLENQVQRP